MELTGRSAVITGANQGLGKAIAREFVAAGANVLLCARDEVLLGEALAELSQAKQAEQQVLGRRCDVSQEKQVAELFAFCAGQFPSLQVLVNNAGVYGPKGNSEEISFEEWCKAIQINLGGTFLPSRYAIRLMKPQRYGKIINLSGGGATAPLPRLSAYAASKAAVVRLTETLAEELRDHSIDVNAIAPGALNTRLLEEVLAAGPEAVGTGFYERALQQREKGGVPLERGARLCVYLASAASDGITGKLISAQWDPWERLADYRDRLQNSDIYTLRRIVPEDRAQTF